MKTLYIKSTSLLLIGLIIFSSCSSTTLIQSTPSGAKLYMNGQLKGNTPYTLKDTRIVGSTTTMQFKMEGYEDLNTAISRDEKLAVGALIGGLFLLIPFLWIMKYDPNHSYELVPVSEKNPNNK
jgi:hypothetical protein